MSSIQSNDLNATKPKLNQTNYHVVWRIGKHTTTDSARKIQQKTEQEIYLDECLERCETTKKTVLIVKDAEAKNQLAFSHEIIPSGTVKNIFMVTDYKNRVKILAIPKRELTNTNAFEELQHEKLIIQYLRKPYENSKKKPLVVLPKLVALDNVAKIKLLPLKEALYAPFLESNLLAQWWQIRKSPFFRKFCLLQQIASGLEFLHNNGVIHRDLHPGNILLNINFKAFITDFGKSYIENFSHNYCPKFFQMYLFPPLKNIDDKSWENKEVDIFSFGILSFMILTGTKPKYLPFVLLKDKELNLEDFNTYMKNQRKDGAPDQCSYWPNFDKLPLSSRDLIFKMLSIDPINRPSISSVRQKLKELYLVTFTEELCKDLKIPSPELKLDCKNSRRFMENKENGILSISAVKDYLINTYLLENNKTKIESIPDEQIRTAQTLRETFDEIVDLPFKEQLDLFYEMAETIKSAHATKLFHANLTLESFIREHTDKMMRLRLSDFSSSILLVPEFLNVRELFKKFKGTCNSNKEIYKNLFYLNDALAHQKEILLTDASFILKEDVTGLGIVYYQILTRTRDLPYSMRQAKKYKKAEKDPRPLTLIANEMRCKHSWNLSETIPQTFQDLLKRMTGDANQIPTIDEVCDQLKSISQVNL